MTEADQPSEANTVSGHDPTSDRHRHLAMGTAAAADTGITNSITGMVLGTSVQVGNVHGGLHIVNEMPKAFSSRDALEQLMTDLTTVHGDYLTMFDAVLAATPNKQEPESPEFAERLTAAQNMLNQLRLNYEPVRVRVRVVAEAFTSAALTTEEQTLANAMVKYFSTHLVTEQPTRFDETPAWVLSGKMQARDANMRRARNARQLVNDAIEQRRLCWNKVCNAYAALQVSRSGLRPARHHPHDQRRP